MTKDDIIANRTDVLRMAREAGLIQYVQVEKTCVSNALERFAALVAAHEREKWEQALPIAMDAMMLQEREACAKVCEEEAQSWFSGYDEEIASAKMCAAAIRARSKHG